MEFRDVFAWTFTPLFLLFPLVLTLVVRARPDGDLATYRRWLRWLVIATIGAEACFVGLALVVSPREAQHLWALFFALWFGLAMRAVRAKNPAWGNVHSLERTTRTAALVRRDREMPSVRWAVWTAWGIWAAALVAILLRPLQTMAGQDGLRFGLALGLQVIVCIWTPLLVRWTVRKIGEEPEPLDAAGSEVLREAYRKHRQAKATGMAGFLVVMTLLVSSILALIAWLPQDAGMGRTMGIVGGGAGALIGLAGGVFGTWMSFQRARIAGLHRDLEAAG